MQFQFRPDGVCSQRIYFDLDGNTVSNVSFLGGCDGNLKGICKLVDGMDADKLIEQLSGIHCGYKATSCPDQLAKAIRAAQQKAQ